MNIMISFSPPWFFDTFFLYLSDTNWQQFSKAGHDCNSFHTAMLDDKDENFGAMEYSEVRSHGKS